MGDQAGAIENYERAIRAAPESPVGYERRGRARTWRVLHTGAMELDEVQGALEDHERAIQLDSNGFISSVVRQARSSLWMQLAQDKPEEEKTCLRAAWMDLREAGRFWAQRHGRTAEKSARARGGLARKLALLRRQLRASAP